MSMRSIEAQYNLTEEERRAINEVFWGQNYELQDVMARLNAALPVRRVNHMKAEVKEIHALNLARLPRREGYAK